MKNFSLTIISSLFLFSISIKAQITSCNQATATVVKIFYPNTTDSVVSGTQIKGMYLCGPNTIVYDTTYITPIWPGCRVAFLNSGTTLIEGPNTCAGSNDFYVKNNATLIIKPNVDGASIFIFHEPSATIIDQTGIANIFACSTITFPTINCFSGINEVQILSIFSLSPNPTSNTLNITTEQNNFQNSEIEIVNYLGQTVLKTEFKNQIDVSELASGFYTLLLKDNSGSVITKKFVKE